MTSKEAKEIGLGASRRSSLGKAQAEIKRAMAKQFEGLESVENAHRRFGQMLTKKEWKDFGFTVRGGAVGERRAFHTPHGKQISKIVYSMNDCDRDYTRAEWPLGNAISLLSSWMVESDLLAFVERVVNETLAEYQRRRRNL